MNKIKSILIIIGMISPYFTNRCYTQTLSETEKKEIKNLAVELCSLITIYSGPLSSTETGSYSRLYEFFGRNPQAVIAHDLTKKKRIVNF